MLGGYLDILGGYLDILQAWTGGYRLGLVVTIGLDWWLWAWISGYRFGWVVLLQSLP